MPVIQHRAFIYEYQSKQIKNTDIVFNKCEIFLVCLQIYTILKWLRTTENSVVAVRFEPSTFQTCRRARKLDELESFLDGDYLYRVQEISSQVPEDMDRQRVEDCVGKKLLQRKDVRVSNILITSVQLGKKDLCSLVS